MIRKTTWAGIACAFGCASAWAGLGAWSGQGPYGGYVFDILPDPHVPATLYTSTRSGIFKSTDSGGTWSPAMDGIVGSVSYGYPLAIDADATDTLYAVDSTGHVYRSADGAANWLQTGYVLPPVNGLPQINQIVDAPGSTTRLYLPTAASGLLVSNDSGATFNPLNGTGANTLPAGVPIQFVAVDPANTSNLLAGTGSFGTYGVGPDVSSLYHSSDGGANWTGVLVAYPGGGSIYAGITDASFGNGGEVYAVADQALASSTDHGASWVVVGTATTNVQGFVTTVKADVGTAHSVYAGGDFGLMHSTDGGVNFTSVASQTNGFTPNGADVATASRLVQSGATWYLASQEAGLYKSTDSGALWNRSDTGIEATNIRALGMVPNGSSPKILAGYGDAFRPSAGIYAGFDAGDGNMSWANSNSGLRAYQIRALTVDPSTTGGGPASTVVYAGGRSEQIVAIAPRNGGLYKSTNGGTGWTTIDTGLPLRPPVASPAPFVGTVRSIVLDPVAPQTVYATSNGCYVYTSFATTPQVPSLVGYCGTPTNSAYNGAWQFRVFKSVDGGAHWATSDNGLPASTVGDTPETLLAVPLVIDPSNPDILYTGTSDSFDPTLVSSPTLLTGIYKSTDGGANWAPVNTGLPTYPSPSPTVLGVLTMAIDPDAPGTLWASVIDINAANAAPSHVYKTTDGGLHWTDSSVGMTSADIRALLVDPTSPTGSGRIVYAAGGGTSGNPGGVFKSYDAGATWHSISVGLPADAALALALDPNDSTKLYAGTSSGVWEITQLQDSDHDGVSDVDEDKGGDPDAKNESWVTYVPPHQSGAAPTLGAPNSPNSPEVAFNDSSVNLPPPQASECSQTQDVQPKPAAAYGPDVIANNLDWSYDVDLIQFEVLDCASVTVTLHWPNFTFGKGWSFRFYGPATPGDDASIKWYGFSQHAVQVDAHSWQVTLTRGAFGSYRPASTGSILFLGGPGYSDRPFASGFD